MTFKNIFTRRLKSYESKKREILRKNSKMVKGAGERIPLDIKVKIARHFEANGFNKRTRLSAEEMYYELSKSSRPITRYS